MELSEIKERFMEDVSDEELEELNELIEGSQNASSPASSISPPHSPSPFLVLLVPQMNRKE
jgi:hypothetical protein